MALKAVLSSLDGINAALHGEYTKGDDGKFYLSVEGVDDMPAVAGLRRKNAELLNEKKTLSDKIVALGVSTPEEVDELRKAAKASSSDKVKELEAKLAGASEAAQKEILKEKERADAEQKAARRYFEDGELTRAISEAKGVPELLSEVIRGKIRTERGSDGKFSLQVLGADGQPRIKDSAGNAFALSDLVAELKADPKYGRAFEADAKGGSGANPGGGAAGGGAKVVNAHDFAAFGANIEAIAKGQVQVVGL